MSILDYLMDKKGGGWFGYRGLFAILFAAPQFALFAYWVTYTGITLSTSMYYLTLLPFVFGVIFTSVLPGKSGISTKTLSIFAIWGVVAYSVYDWSRVPMNIFFGVPFWDHWFDWGASILGSQGPTIFTYENLTTGLISHILRGWGFAMAYYILVRRVTLVSAFVFAWFMTVFYWIVFPTFVLTDALPPWIWWFVAWMSHMVFAVGLWLAPRLFSYYTKESQAVSEQKTIYHRNWNTTIFGVLGTCGFGLAIGCILFGYVVSSQPPSIYPVFGYGKPPPIVIEGFSSYYWAIPAVVAGVIFLYLAMRSRKKDLTANPISYT
jgi:hypothetical protein